MLSYFFKLQMNVQAFIFISIWLYGLAACNSPQQESVDIPTAQGPFLTVLGVAQDAGYPQAACQKACCQRVWDNPSMQQMVVSIGIVHPNKQQHWLLDATPDFPQQLYELEQQNKGGQLSGIFLTHGHIGHYTGLMYLGREVMGAKQIPVHVMARMDTFLRNNGPWSQLVSLGNIDLQRMQDQGAVVLSEDLQITPLLVPHRDEFTETVGYHVQGPNRSALFIPDIDKWDKWDQDIIQWVRQVDIAFLDASFFQEGEIPGRDMSEIPHPFVVESMVHFSSLSSEEKARIHFIHFNHTNPLLDPDSKASQQVREAGFQIAQQGQVLVL